MKRIAFGTIATVFLLTQGAAAASWSQFSFATTPQNAPKVLAAADKLMSSATGKQFPGRLHLQTHLADGANPATHSFAPLYKSAAEREAFVQKMQADPAWNEFMATMAEVAQPVSQVMYRSLKSWGKAEDTDPVWMLHAFTVRDPAAFLAAIEKLMASPTGKQFPGQVHLSAVVAGGIGMSPVTHVISVGWASEAEMESWAAVQAGSADWSAFMEASRKAAEYRGGSLARDLKTWGPASLADLTAP